MLAKDELSSFGTLLYARRKKKTNGDGDGDELLPASAVVQFRLWIRNFVSGIVNAGPVMDLQEESRFFS